MLTHKAVITKRIHKQRLSRSNGLLFCFILQKKALLYSVMCLHSLRRMERCHGNELSYISLLFGSYFLTYTHTLTRLNESDAEADVISRISGPPSSQRPIDNIDGIFDACLFRSTGKKLE